MKLLIAVAGLLSVFALAGCNQESAPGGPGATSSTQKAPAGRDDAVGRNITTLPTRREPSGVASGNNDNTFTLSVPKSDTNIDRGKTGQVTISIDRGSNFKQEVKLSFKAPQGLRVTPVAPLIPAGSEKVEVTIEATPDAPAGKTNIEVTAMPATGKAVSMPLSIEVKAAG